MTLLAAAGVAATSVFGQAAIGSRLTPSARASADIPAAYLALYQEAAATCPGLPWTVLAAIGQVESDQGRNAHTSSDGAVGIVQMLPATFEEYAHPVPPGEESPPDPLDPTDEIYAAARMLCTDGARDGTDIDGAIFAYCADPLVVPTWAGDPSWLLGFRLGEVGITRRLTVLG